MNNCKRVTVFTPTYNRENTISRVWESLCAQTYKDFEWIIIDDGSTDDTKERVDEFKKQDKFSIRYIYQENSGKHIAMNRAVSMAQGELFVIADSDDSFLPNALQVLVAAWDGIEKEKRQEYKGVTCRCLDAETREPIGCEVEAPYLDCSELDAVFRYKFRFEMWGILSTKVLRKYPFPEEKGIHFYPEAVIWQTIARTYKTRYINAPLRLYYRDQENATTNKNTGRYAENIFLWSHYINNVTDYTFRYDKKLFLKSYLGLNRDGILCRLSLKERRHMLNKRWKKALLTLTAPIGRVLTIGRKKKRLKIAMIGHKRIPSREGGIEIVVKELSEEMVNKGLLIDCYNRKERYNSRIKEYEGIHIINIPTSQKRSLNAFLYSMLATLRAVFGRYDVIHYHAEGPCVALILPHLLRIPTIATIHGLDWQRAKWGGFAKKYLLLGEKIAAKYADVVVVMSANVQEYFKEIYNRETVYIANGVRIDQAVQPKIIKERFGLEKNSYILYLGRLVPEKGVHYLIEAFSKIKTDKKLVIAGDTSHSDEYVRNLHELAQNDERILFTGFADEPMVKELYSNCCIYILPSDVEGMPISLLEAVSFGTPCLVSDIKENVEVVGNYAVSFKKGNIDDLREKLAEMLKQTKSNNYVRSVPMELLKKYDWDYISDLYIEEYKVICK